MHDPASAKGRAGVAIASRHRAHIHRVELGPTEFDSAGRWLEADYEIGGTTVTVVSTYVHSGEVDTPKQDEKWKFLDAMTERLPALRAHNPLAVVVGDLNVGHDERDIKNWKGNVKRAGFLPRERAYFSRFFGADGEPRRGRRRLHRARVSDGSTSVATRPATSTVRTRGGPGAARPSTTTPAGASTTRWPRPSSPRRSRTYTVDRADAYDQRWSDHAPVVVDYEL